MSHPLSPVLAALAAADAPGASGAHRPRPHGTPPRY